MLRATSAKDITLSILRACSGVSDPHEQTTQAKVITSAIFTEVAFRVYFWSAAFNKPIPAVMAAAVAAKSIAPPFSRLTAALATEITMVSTPRIVVFIGVV